MTCRHYFATSVITFEPLLTIYICARCGYRYAHVHQTVQDFGGRWRLAGKLLHLRPPFPGTRH